MVLLCTGIQQTQGMQYRMPTSPVQIPIPSRSNSTSNMQYPQEMPDEGAVAGTRAGKVQAVATCLENRYVSV